MGKSVTVQLPTLYKKQYECFYGPQRFKVTEATIKSGKSVGAIHYLVSESINDPKKLASLWCSPEYPHARAMFERLERWMTAADPARSIWDSNKSELWISINGSKIWFKGADNFDAIYGKDYGRAVIDEASRCRSEVWPAVYSTLTTTMGKCRIIGNVKGRKNWAYKLAREAQAGKSGWSYHKLTAQDAIDGGVMTAEALEDARQNLPNDVFRELYFAEATEDGSNPFRLDCIAKVIRPLSSKSAVCFGVDLARKHDYTVCVGLDEDGNVCKFERFTGTDWAEAMHRIGKVIGDTLTYADATGVGDPIVEQLSRTCMGVEPFMFTPTSKQQIMSGLAVAIQQGKTSVLDGVMRSEMESFEYVVTPSGNVRYSAPSGEHDDCVCALAMAVSAFDKYATAPVPMVVKVGGGSGTIDGDESMWTPVRTGGMGQW